MQPLGRKETPFQYVMARDIESFLQLGRGQDLYTVLKQHPELYQHSYMIINNFAGLQRLFGKNNPALAQELQKIEQKNARNFLCEAVQRDEGEIVGNFFANRVLMEVQEESRLAEKFMRAIGKAEPKPWVNELVDFSHTAVAVTEKNMEEWVDLALDQAVSYDQTAALMYLYRLGANVNKMTHHGTAGFSFLHDAAEAGALNFVRAAVQQYNGDVNLLTRNGALGGKDFTCLDLVEQKPFSKYRTNPYRDKNRAEIIDIIVAAGGVSAAEVERQEFDQRFIVARGDEQRPFHYMTHATAKNLLRLSGVDVGDLYEKIISDHGLDENGYVRNFQQFATAFGPDNQEIYANFNQVAQENAKGYVVNIIRNGYPEKLEHFLANEILLPPAENGAPRWVSCKANNGYVVREENRANWLEFAMSVAAEYNRPQFLPLLHKNGVSVNKNNQSGFSPLQFAVYSGAVDFVKEAVTHYDGDLKQLGNFGGVQGTCLDIVTSGMLNPANNHYIALDRGKPANSSRQELAQFIVQAGGVKAADVNEAANKKAAAPHSRFPKNAM
ncbi:MAG: ankyrin repeat domain-containing protein [Alphaproteobacteria bacterium]